MERRELGTSGLEVSVEENIAAVDIALTPANVALLDEAFPIGTAARARCPPDRMCLLETEQAR